MYATHCLKLMLTAIKYHQDIPYGYIDMASTRIVWNKTNQRAITQKVREQTFLHATGHLDLIHIAIKFHSGIPYGYRVMMSTRLVCKKTNRRAVTQKLRKGEQPFCMGHAKTEAPIFYL